jgi:hypothetical protein
VSNQVLVRWLAPDGDNARLTDAVIAGVRAEGVAFFSGTTYHVLQRHDLSRGAVDAHLRIRLGERRRRC